MDAIRKARSREEKREGLHVSTICDDIIKTVDRKRYEKEINETSVIAFQEIGNALEDVIAAALSRRIPGWRKPAPRADRRGVIGSPDGLREGSRTIDEIKATWVSEGTPDRHPFVVTDQQNRIIQESLKFWRYRMQATHYAYIWGANRIVFHILFVNGNYRPPFPNVRELTLRVTEADKLTNAKQLWGHAEDRGWLPRGKAV